MPHPHLRLPRLRAVARALPIVLASCGGGTEPSARSEVRILHAAPGQFDADVNASGQTITSGLAFGEHTRYLPFPVGDDVPVVVRAAGTPTVLVDTALALERGRRYTLILRGFQVNTRLQVLPTFDPEPPEGSGRIHFFHVAPSMPMADIRLTAPSAEVAEAGPQLTGIPYGGSGAVTVAAGVWRLRATQTGTTTVNTDSGAEGFAVENGDVQTWFAIDAPAGGRPFAMIRIDEP